MGYALLSGSAGGVIFYGDSENLPLTDGDRTIHAKVNLASIEEVPYMFRVGRLRLAVIDTGGGTYKFAAIKSFSGGSITAISTTTPVADTTYDLYATWDRSTATVAIIVNGTEEDTTEDAASYVNTPNLPTYSASLPGSSWGTEWAAWDTLLSFAPVDTPEFTDDFNRADSTNLGSDWNERNGSSSATEWTIDTNRLRLGTAFGRQAMYTTPMSDTDHYVEFDVVTHQGNTFGIVRSGSSTLSPLQFYYAGRDATNLIIGKFDGSGGTVAAAAAESMNGKRIRVEAIGATIKLYLDGVEKVSYTDGSPLTGTYVGIWGAGNNTLYDNFEAGIIT